MMIRHLKRLYVTVQYHGMAGIQSVHQHQLCVRTGSKRDGKPLVMAGTLLTAGRITSSH